MNRTIKEATVKRFHYESHDQLRTHLADFMAAYNFARRLKTLSGLTPYEYIAKIWTSEPDRFIVDPIHQMPGLNTWFSLRLSLSGSAAVQPSRHRSIASSYVAWASSRSARNASSSLRCCR